MRSLFHCKFQGHNKTWFVWPLNCELSKTYGRNEKYCTKQNTEKNNDLETYSNMPKMFYSPELERFRIHMNNFVLKTKKNIIRTRTFDFFP